MRRVLDAWWNFASRCGWVGLLSSLFPTLVLAADLGEGFPLGSRFSPVMTVESFALAGDSTGTGSKLDDSTASGAWGGGETVAPAPAPERGRPFRDLKPGRDVLHGVRVLGADTRAVLTGPFHMDRGDALWTLGALVATGALYARDQEILDGFARSTENDAYKAAIEPGRALEKLGFIGSTAPYYAAGLTLGYLLRIDPLTEMTAEVLESHFIAGLVRNVLEESFGRSRPREGKGARAFRFRGSDSFPSGHASVVFEVATVAAHHTRSIPLRVLYYAIATSISLQRVDSFSHWPSDIFVGAVIGTTVARTLVRRHDEAKKRAPAAPRTPSTAATPEVEG